MENPKLIQNSGNSKQPKSIFKFILIIVAVSIGWTLITEFTSSNQIKIEEKTCKNSVKFGNSTICLPDIDAMNESYKISKLRTYADSMFDKQNIILGFYLNDSTYNSIESSSFFQFDDYLILLGAVNLQNYDVKKADFEKMSNSMLKYFDDNSERIFQNAVERFQKLVDITSLGKFVLVEQYSLNDRIKTFAFLTKIQTNGTEKVQIGIINVVWVRKKIVNVNYYKTYEGIESMKAAKAKNDYMVLQFYNENN